MVGIRDVAKESGAAIATVSRYLNGQIDLRPATKKRIDDAIEKLGYVPNVMARRLASGSSETLGLMTTDIEYPFFAAIASAAEAEAARAGFQLAIFNSRNSVEKELEILRYVETRQIDGLIMLTNHIEANEIATQIGQSGRVVLLDEDVSGVDAPKIFAENWEGGAFAAEHLLKHGHTQVAFVSGPRGMISVEERLKGFIERLGKDGIEIDPDMVVCGEYSEAFGVGAIEKLISANVRPTAIFAGADNLAVGIMKGARRLGISVPGELSLIGFDDMSFAEMLDPPLTTIKQDAHTFGRQGVRAMLALLKKKPLPPIVRVPVELIERASVGRPKISA
ncbi:MAG: LacI family DNA-binding transcriptional regulator [Roseovarius sp.]|nr:LacI family DNA-binding transcriptional regulator [Roseovarius sp.]